MSASLSCSQMIIIVVDVIIIVIIITTTTTDNCVTGLFLPKFITFITFFSQNVNDDFNH